MSEPKITLFGWYRWTHGKIFDAITVPEGADKQTLIDTILLNGGEFGTVYADPDFLAFQIATLSNQYKQPMERTWRALTEEYNPLHNYDRYEESEDATSGSSSSTASTEGEDFYQGDTSTAYSPVSKNTGADEGSTSSEAQNTHSAHLYGQIGTTKYSELLLDEIKVRTELNFYQVWAEMFITEICVGVY